MNPKLIGKIEAICLILRDIRQELLETDPQQWGTNQILAQADAALDDLHRLLISMEEKEHDRKVNTQGPGRKIVWPAP
jgi:hypothetical protein